MITTRYQSQFYLIIHSKYLFVTIISQIREDYRALKGEDLITPVSLNNPVIERNGRLGKDACQILAAAVNSVDPYGCVLDQLNWDGSDLLIGKDRIPFQEFDRVFLIGFGKASVPMAKAVLDHFKGKVDFARVITKAPSFLKENGYLDKLEVVIGGHPVPDENSIQATRILLSSLPTFTSRDLFIVVISGGGSALFASPLGDVTLDDLQIMTNLLLRCGAEIQEINTLRKHMDGVKGGRLAESLSPACVHTLILSDVIGDRMDMIASGPTVADPTTYSDAWKIIKKYHLEEEMPQTILSLIQGGIDGRIPETLKEKDLAGLYLSNHLVGTNRIASQAANEEAIRLSYHSQVVSNTLTGLTKDVSNMLAQRIGDIDDTERPCCLIYGGETTVKVIGDGLGGRNQDLVLRMVSKLACQRDLLFISLATDGEDGPTDAAGAASDTVVYDDGIEKYLDLATYIITNNAYEYLDKVGALIKTGPTGTNVNDLILIIAE